MLKELNSIEEIKSFFEELDKKPMADMQKARIYGMAKAYQDLEDKEKPIRDYYDKNKYSRLLEVYTISDDVLIAKEEYKSNSGVKTFFIPFINGQKINECAYSFDLALIIALSNKYKESEASGYIAKILGIKTDE